VLLPSTPWTSDGPTVLAYRTAAGAAVVLTALKFGGDVLQVAAVPAAEDARPRDAGRTTTLDRAACLDSGGDSPVRRVRWAALTQRVHETLLSVTAAPAANAAAPAPAPAPARPSYPDSDPLRDPRFVPRAPPPMVGGGGLRPGGLGTRDLDPFAPRYTEEQATGALGTNSLG
jgi:hypothetical protein